MVTLLLHLHQKCYIVLPTLLFSPKKNYFVFVAQTARRLNGLAPSMLASYTTILSQEFNTKLDCLEGDQIRKRG